MLTVEPSTQTFKRLLFRSRRMRSGSGCACPACLRLAIRFLTETCPAGSSSPTGRDLGERHRLAGPAGLEDALRERVDVSLAPGADLEDLRELGRMASRRAGRLALESRNGYTRSRRVVLRWLSMHSSARSQDWQGG